MSPALRSFLAGLVDYAGLFPPAGLEMTAAVDQYARHRGETVSWMLGRFVVPAGRLADLQQAAAGLMTPERPWAFSVLLGDRQDPARSLTALGEQATAVARFLDRGQAAVAVDAFEIAVPADLAVDQVSGFVTEAMAILRSAGLAGREVFWEIPPDAPQSAEAPLLAGLRAAADHLTGSGRSADRLGVKLRCGGITPEAFPSVERVARIIGGARDRRLPLKGTAGLHHPVRFQAARPTVMMHGFFNFFGAGLLAHAHGWDAERLATVVAETDPAAFGFSAAGFHWREHRVAAEDVARLRRDYLRGFGSCSFAEPREDLENLGHLV
ncbi:hypothetical protein CSB20_00935 [bacterium DOLZORAL124_64_63]|nr:MAG: hypothetical protein CSB20_00935 [bacterium DOLZORAL124_64_63]